MKVIRKVQALIVVSLEPTMAESLFTGLLVLLLLSIPNQPDALVEAESSLSCSSEEFACQDQSKCIPKSSLCSGDFGVCDDLSDIYAESVTIALMTTSSFVR